MAGALGGRLSWRRSFLLAATATVVSVPILVGERLLAALVPGALPPAAVFLLFLLGPVLWFRHMSLFGLSRPDHARSLPASLVQPVLSFLGVLVLVPPTVDLVVEGVVFLLFGFLGAAALLRAADRPLRREFGTSGVALIRPVLDHINLRDPAATAELEGFFARFSIPADLRLTLIAIRSGAGPRRRSSLPTVHPGPFAALGASDLPRKLAERLGPEAGVVFAPHTPCNHDLDLPTEAEVAKVGEAAAALLRSLPASGSSRAGPLLPVPKGSFARGQRLGDAVLVTVTQAPAPTDDIDFAIVDPLLHAPAPGAPRLALIDAHNSYVEGQGDLTYATPNAAKLRRDIEAAVDGRRRRRRGRTVPVRRGRAVGLFAPDPRDRPHGDPGLGRGGRRSSERPRAHRRQQPHPGPPGTDPRGARPPRRRGRGDDDRQPHRPRGRRRDQSRRGTVPGTRARPGREGGRRSGDRGPLRIDGGERLGRDPVGPRPPTGVDPTAFDLTRGHRLGVRKRVLHDVPARRDELPRRAPDPLAVGDRSTMAEPGDGEPLPRGAAEALGDPDALRLLAELVAIAPTNLEDPLHDRYEKPNYRRAAERIVRAARDRGLATRVFDPILEGPPAPSSGAFRGRTSSSTSTSGRTGPSSSWPTTTSSPSRSSSSDAGSRPPTHSRTVPTAACMVAGRTTTWGAGSSRAWPR